MTTNTVLPSLSLSPSPSLSLSPSLPWELLTLPELWPRPKRLELLTWRASSAPEWASRLTRPGSTSNTEVWTRESLTVWWLMPRLCPWLTINVSQTKFFFLQNLSTKCWITLYFYTEKRPISPMKRSESKKCSSLNLTSSIISADKTLKEIVLWQQTLRATLSSLSSGPPASTPQSWPQTGGCPPSTLHPSLLI